MASDGNNDNVPPAYSIPWQPYIEPRTFAGQPGEDVDAWLNFYQRASRFNGWNATGQLSNVGLLREQHLCGLKATKKA